MRLKITLIITTIIFIFSFSDTFSQGRQRSFPGKISGTVSDSLTGKPMPYSTLTLYYQDTLIVTGAIADAKGKFLIENVPPTSLKLKAHFIGYENKFIENVTLRQGQSKMDIGNITLIPATVSGDEVVVEGEKDLVTYEIDRKVINLSKSEASKGSTVIQALENIPSVRVDVEGNIYLRGSSNFTLLIDGKPTVLSAKDLLRQIPAESVDRLEIITNPSAKYDPDGVSGIVNLIMKKDMYSGFSGIANATVATRDKYSGSFQGDYKNSSFRLFGGADINKRAYYPVSDFMRDTWAADTLFVRSYMERLYLSDGGNLKAGGDYFIDENNSISLTADYGFFGFDRDMPADYTEWNPGQSDRRYYLNRDKFYVSGNYYSGFLNFDHKFNEDGHKIETNFLASQWTADVDQNSSKETAGDGVLTSNEILRRNKSATFADGTSFRYKADYTLPIEGGSKLEAGFQSDFTDKNADFQYSDYDDITGEWSLNTNYSNVSTYDHLINSIYTTYSDVMMDIQYMIGIRAENFNRNVDQITTNESYKLNQFNFFPSLHLTYSLSQEQQVQASYSRRVYRPDHRQLNPFPDFIDDYYISKGNPDLKPQFTDSYELNYRNVFGPVYISAEGYFRQTNDLISRTMFLQDDGKLLITSVNEDKDYLYGMEFSVNSNPMPWLRVYAAANYYKYNLVQTEAGESITRSSTVPDINGALIFYLSKETVVQLTGYYSGEKVVSDGYQKEVFTAGASLRQDLFDRKLSLVLNVRDMFKTGRYEFDQKQLNYHSYGYFDPEAPVVSLTLTYTINNFQKERSQDQKPDTNFEGGI